MLNYVRKLRDSEFVDLLVATKKMRDGDIKNCEYMDKETYRQVRVLDCSPFVDNREPDQHFLIDDFNISEKESLFDYYLFMLNQFGYEWYEKAKKYLSIKQNAQNLATLKQAKNAYQADLETNATLNQ